jgi:hypothetical protein
MGEDVNTKFSFGRFPLQAACSKPSRKVRPVFFLTQFSNPSIPTPTVLQATLFFFYSYQLELYLLAEERLSPCVREQGEPQSSAIRTLKLAF